MADLDSNARSIQSLYGLYFKGDLLVNRRYQRKLVWTLEEKQRLVESVLNGYPIPAILLVELEDGSVEVIDGLQRLHTIMSFIETAFTTLEGELFDIEQFTLAKTRSSDGIFFPTDGDRISIDEVNSFLNYNLSTSTMRRASEQEIDDVFSRINTYGRQLSNQERRQAGVQSEFANLVRDIGAGIRGDSTSEILSLEKMPEISIDLPKAKHNYGVKAENTPWVKCGVLRSTDLRDGLDEECIADIVASIVGKKILDRSRGALDSIYEIDSMESDAITVALSGYGSLRVKQEVEHTVTEIWRLCNHGDDQIKLSHLLFKKSNNNSITLIFSTLTLALHECLFLESKKIADYQGLRGTIENLNSRLETSSGNTPSAQRRENVNVIKGLILPNLAENEDQDRLSGQSIIDIDTHLRRSQIELSTYELKQGILNLDDKREANDDVYEKVILTICAIANTGKAVGKEVSGRVLIGIADSDTDALKIADLDRISTVQVGNHFVVGVQREADALGITIEEYVSTWASKIRDSELSSPLKEMVLESIDFNDYYGLGVLVLTVPKQNEMAWLGSGFAWRSHDSTKFSNDPKQAVRIARRFE